MGQNPSKRSKNQAYPLPNPAFYPPPPVYPYQHQHYGFPQQGGHHVITPYPMLMYEPPHKRRKTRRKSGGTRRRTGQSAGPRRAPGTPGPAPAPRPSSRAGGTTRLRVTNSSAGDELDDDAPGPTLQSFSQPNPQRTPGPGPSGYVPPYASQHLDDDDEPVVSIGIPIVPFDEDARPVEQRARTPHPGPVHTAPSSMQFTPHTRGLANFPVTDSEDEDEGEPVIPTQMGARSQGRSRAGSASGHGGNPRRAATPGLGLSRSVTTGAALPTRMNPLPRPPQDLSRSTPWRRLRELDFSTTGHGTSSHGHGTTGSSVGHGTSTSHVPGTSIGHANGRASSHGHDRTRSLDANPSRTIVQPPVQPPHTSQHHRARTVGSFFRRGGIGAGVSHVSHVGGGIWRRVSQRRRPLNRPQSEEEFVEVQPPTPAAPPPGTITPYTITADQTRTPATSRPVTPAPPPPMPEPGGEESLTPFMTAGGLASTPRIVAGGPPGMTRTTTPPTQPGRPVTPLGVSFTGTATPGIATPALGLVNPPFDQPVPPVQPPPMTQPSAPSTYTGPIHSTYDQPRASSYDARPPASSQPPPPVQPQYSSTAPPLTFSQLSLHPESGLLNHSAHRIAYTNPPTRNQPASHQTYPTAAHLFEALKFLPHHPEHAAAIREAPTVADVYRLSSQWDADVRSDWGHAFLGLMEEVLMYKFRQHPSLRGVLLGTGVGGEGEQRGRELVYMDERDKFWGRAQDGAGRNELGKALMRVRERLKAEGYGS